MRGCSGESMFGIGRIPDKGMHSEREGGVAFKEEAGSTLAGACRGG